MTAAAIAAVRWAAWRYTLLFDRHGTWMLWNLALALVPAVLASRLFRPVHVGRQGPLWWLGAAWFLAFLPNAPYVLTDVIHVVADVRHGLDDTEVFAVYGPAFGLFFAVGFSAYVWSLRRLRRFVRAGGWSRRRSIALELCVHGLCAIGVYLGRVVRLNSWQLVSEPHSVLAGLGSLLGLSALAAVAATLTALIVGSLIVDATADGLRSKAALLFDRSTS